MLLQRPEVSHPNPTADNVFQKAFDGAKLDALIFPQFNFPPKRNGDSFTPQGRDANLYSSMTGFPALVVPMGLLYGKWLFKRSFAK